LYIDNIVQPVHSKYRSHILIFLFFASFYTLLTPGVLNNPDAGTRLLTAMSLVRTGSIEMKQSEFPGIDLGAFETAKDKSGNWVEMFNEGQSLLLVPPVAVALAAARVSHQDPKKMCELVVALFVYPILSSCAVLAFYSFLSEFSRHEAPKIVACLLVGATSCWVVYSYNGQHELQVSALLLLQWIAIVRHLRSGNLSPLLLSALAAGGLLLLRYSMVPCVAVELVWLVSGYRASKLSPARAALNLSIFSLVVALTYTPQMYFNWAKGGGLFSPPVVSVWGRSAQWYMSLPILEGMRITLWSPSDSIFLYNPIVILGLILGLRYWKELVRSEYALIFFYGLLTYVILIHWIGWRDNIAWGPRLFVHLLPVFVTPVWYALEHQPSRWLTRTCFTLALFGFVIQILGTLYATETDYSAVRTGTIVEYGSEANLVNVSTISYRLQDFSEFIHERSTFTPARFSHLPHSDTFFVPQWWWIRFWTKPQYRVPHTLTFLLAGGLCCIFLASGRELIRLCKRSDKSRRSS
jgi:hypothetical protein